MAPHRPNSPAVPHQIREDLTIILSYLDLAARAMDADSQPHPRLDMARAAARRIAEATHAMEQGNADAQHA